MPGSIVPNAMMQSLAGRVLAQGAGPGGGRQGTARAKTRGGAGVQGVRGSGSNCTQLAWGVPGGKADMVQGEDCAQMLDDR